jgi:hypothetical protein
MSNQEPKIFDAADPVVRSIRRHKNKILGKYTKYINDEMKKSGLVGKPNGGLESIKYIKKLEQDILDKVKQSKSGQP